MKRPTEIIDYAPFVFAACGVLLIVFAAYVGGGDRLTCVRGGRVDCQLVNFRWLGVATLGRTDVADVVGVFVRTTTTVAGDQPFERTVKTNTNNALTLRTRAGADVETLGGEATFDFKDRIQALIAGGGPDSITMANSYWPVSAGCFALGLFFSIFGGAALLTD